VWLGFCVPSKIALLRPEQKLRFLYLLLVLCPVQPIVKATAKDQDRTTSVLKNTAVYIIIIIITLFAQRTQRNKQ